MSYNWADNSRNGAISLNATPAQQTVSNAIGTLDSEDYFRLNINSRSHLNFSLSGLTGNADLQLMDSNGRIISSSTNGGTANESIDRIVDTGTYFIRVFQANALVLNSNYSLNLRGSRTGVIDGTTVDFNGDGRTDFLRQERGEWALDKVNTTYVLLSNGNGTFNRTVLPENLDLHGDFTNLYMGDFNGDGRTDFLRQEKGGWGADKNYTGAVFLSNGNGTFNRTILSEGFDLDGDFTNLYMGDFNGDGRTDFMRQEKGGWAADQNYTASVFFSNGNGTFNRTILPENLDLKGDLTNLYMGDFNGDGRTDFLRQEKGGWARDRANTVNAFLSNGNGTFNRTILPEEFDLTGNFTNLYIGDFNGDGRTDFLRQERGVWADDHINTSHVFLSNGNGTFTRSSPLDQFGLHGDLTNLFVGDFNGDGRTDLLRQERGIWANDRVKTAHILLSTGNGGFNSIGLSEDLGLHGDLTNLFTNNAPHNFRSLSFNSTEARASVNQIYRDVLGRDADPLSQSWLDTLRQGWTFQEIRAGVARSDEARSKINQIYREALGRDADPAGMEHHINLLASSQTLQQIRDGIFNSEEAKRRLSSSLPTTTTEANKFFKLQFLDSNYNPNYVSGRDSTGNCGPASLAMVIKTLGLEPAGLNVQQSIDRAITLMGREPKATFTSDWQIRTGIRNAGGRAENFSSWQTLDQKLAENKPVIAWGRSSSTWQSQFPNRSLFISSEGDHVLAILGKAVSGRYIVADPLYRGGSVEMTKEQLARFFTTGNPLGTAFAK
ncbi:MAG: FG-GAP-like repeat-containing protein [Leptolyngbya sp. Prado105]|nr:FG-GAP-like repeat-containing protein [Leptolyngbya sp. Prado105]